MLTENGAEDKLAALIAEHEALHGRWRQSGEEQDRRLMAAAWSIWITSPGSHLDGGVEIGGLCRPTVLTCHWLPEPGEDYWRMVDHLGYRGACLGCGWVSRDARRGRNAENLAVEDAHDHSHPGWRSLPVVAAAPSLESPAAIARHTERWLTRWGSLLPDGWLDRGGPIRTHRPPPGCRHVPGRAPGGGYDLAADPRTHEEPGGQLTLL